MKTLLLLGVMAALFIGSANAQVADKDHVWATPGNAFVGGVMQMCQNTAGVAVPCGNTTSAAGYPPGATPLQVTTNGGASGANVTLPGVAGKTTYLCGFAISPGSATAAITINLAVTGIVAGYSLFVGAPVTAAGTTSPPITQNFTPCVPASATNTAIVVAIGALGTGGTNQTVNAWGYQF